MLPYTVHPLSPMRRIIAARMTEAVRTIPHFRLTAEIEIDSLLEVRKMLQDRNPEVRLSLNDFFIKACAAALTAIGRARPRWVVTSTGESRVVKIISATLSVDHRALDGVAASSFMSALRRHIELPM